METAINKLSKQELLTLVSSQLETIQQQEEAHQETIEQYQQNIQQHQETIEQYQVDISSYQWKITAYQSDIAYYKGQIAQLQRMLFGQKRERFEGNSNQLLLPFELDQEQEKKQEEVLIERISYLRNKQSTHQGRLKLPEHLPVEEVEIYPEGDLSEMVCIGKEIREELDCVPARFFIRRYIRYKYAPKDRTGVLIGDLPEPVIEKGKAGSGLIASILVDKYVDHLPLYRQKQRFLREKIPIASSTIEGHTKQGLERLEILYDHLVEDTKSKGYLQVDETPIRVLDSNKKGSTHQGYYWVYHDPIEKTVFFDYQPSRSIQGPSRLLSGFKGYLQSDGYEVYTKISKDPSIIHVGCWAHARRHFEQALANDKQRSEIALSLIRDLYGVETQAREEQLSSSARKELRLSKALPIINSLGKWISQEAKHTLPKSQIGKAMRYAMERWDELSAYLYDGELEIDNNLVENAIRPVALGRKNYLFAGSHQAAQRAAMIYSFFAVCKKHEVNPFDWLKFTLENIMTIKYENITDLYPHNFKKLTSNM